MRLIDEFNWRSRSQRRRRREFDVESTSAWSFTSTIRQSRTMLKRSSTNEVNGVNNEVKRVINTTKTFIALPHRRLLFWLFDVVGASAASCDAETLMGAIGSVSIVHTNESLLYTGFATDSLYLLDEPPWPKRTTTR